MANSVIENLKSATAMFDNLNLNRFGIGTNTPNNSGMPYVPPIPKRIRVYTLTNPDCFILQDLTNTEDKAKVLLLERKDGGPGKFSIKSMYSYY